MILRAAIRIGALGLALIAGGCATLESIEASFQDAPFTAKPVAAVATAPVFRVGDVFRFRIGDNLIAETVERVDAKGVWWRDSLGRRWVGGAGMLIPTRAVLKSNNTPKIINSAMQATGDLFPLTPGKTVAYRYTVQDGFRTARTYKQSCTVGGFGSVKTIAGAFDAYRLKCNYDGVVRNNYYAPALGRVVLQTSDTFFDSVKRELVGFERGAAVPLRTAKGGIMMPAKDGKMTPANVAPAGKSMALATGGRARYGVQLAAYRSPSRAKQAWTRLRRVGGGLLDGQKPTIERQNGASGPMFRLIVGAYATKNKARAYCRTLKRGGIDCWPRARMAAKPPMVVGAAPADLRVVRR